MNCTASKDSSHQDSDPNLSPSGLAWRYRGRKSGALIVRHEDEAELASLFAELIEHGVSPEAISDEIDRKGRRRFEPVWEMTARLSPKANGKPGLYAGLSEFVKRHANEKS